MLKLNEFDFKIKILTLKPNFDNCFNQKTANFDLNNQEIVNLTLKKLNFDFKTKF